MSLHGRSVFKWPAAPSLAAGPATTEASVLFRRHLTLLRLSKRRSSRVDHQGEHSQRASDRRSLISFIHRGSKISRLVRSTVH